MRLWRTLWERKGNKWHGIFAYKELLSWRGKKKQKKNKVFCLSHGYREAVTTLVPQIPASLATPHFFLLAAITKHWPFNVTAPQRSLVLLTIQCHPTWSQILPSLQINISANDSQICNSLCSGITFPIAYWTHSSGLYLLYIHYTLVPEAGFIGLRMILWSKNPIQPPCQ